MATSLSLLSNANRVETPFVKVQIGDYVFGVAEKRISKIRGSDGVYKTVTTKYPNYVQDLQVSKVSGKVNTYELSLAYPITAGSDPNFFDKVFSSVSSSRKIIFSYGDLATPQFAYRNEEAIITNVTQQLSFSASVITYRISAVSSGKLLSAGSYNFKARYDKPSKIIKELLQNKAFGLQDIFYGMRDIGLVEQAGLIRGDDKIVYIEAKTNISVLDYLSYLVQCMTKDSILNRSNSGVYTFSIIDDTTGKFGGPYFKIDLISKAFDTADTYEIEAGYPGSAIITDIQIQNDESYSIFYEYQNKINDAEYRQTISDTGELIDQYAPILSSGNAQNETNSVDATWWRKVTEYPITLTLSMRGLLRSAILMTNVRLKLYYYGKLHSASGKYIVTKQVDRISASGYSTQLTLTRIGADE